MVWTRIYINPNRTIFASIREATEKSTSKTFTIQRLYCDSITGREVEVKKWFAYDELRIRPWEVVEIMTNKAIKAVEKAEEEQLKYKPNGSVEEEIVEYALKNHKCLYKRVEANDYKRQEFFRIVVHRVTMAIDMQLVDWGLIVREVLEDVDKKYLNV